MYNKYSTKMTNPDELRIITKALSDTLIEYIPALPVIEKSVLFMANKSEFMSSEESQEDDKVIEDFIQWILEDKSDNAELIVELREALHKLYNSEKDAQDEGSHCKLDLEKLKTILYFMDGQFLKQLPKEVACRIANALNSKRIIPKCPSEEEDVYKVCLAILRSVRPRKPDWPFEFLKHLRSMKPLQESDGREMAVSQQHQAEDQTEVCCVAECSATATSISKGNESSVATPSVSKESTESLQQWPPEGQVHKNLELLETESKASKFSDKENTDALAGQEMATLQRQAKCSAAALPVSGGIAAGSQSQPSEDPLDQARKILDDSSRMSSKFSEITKFSETQKKAEYQHMADSSDVSSDDEDEDEDLDSFVTEELNLWSFQEELAENALKGQNTIICAPTGSGKTRVATLIILRHLEDEASGEKKRKVVFLARTVPLVMQQFRTLKKFLPKKYKSMSMSGDSEFSTSLHKLVDEYDVFVMTPRVLENHVQGPNPSLREGLKVFSLLLFDECHHTRKSEAYKTLMLSYLRLKNSPGNLPQIVGMTASIGMEKAKTEAQELKKILEICGNLDADSISVVKKHTDELSDRVPIPHEEIISLNERNLKKPFVKKILDNLKQLEKSVRHHITELEHNHPDLDQPELTKKLEALEKISEEDKKYQKYGQYVVALEKEIGSIKAACEFVRALGTITHHLKVYNVALEYHDLVQSCDVIKYLEGKFRIYAERLNSLTKAEKACYSLFEELKAVQQEKGKAQGNPNLTKLKNVLNENLLEHQGTTASEERSKNLPRGIIFVKTRALAHALVSWLNKKPGPLKDLRATVFTGSAAVGEDGGMTDTQQEEAIESFKKGNIRLLVATSVGEEGLDIPDCNLVIKYNHVGNEVTTVQTRGRSRKRGGKSYLLAFSEICLKEKINQANIRNMNRAVLKVANMKPQELREVNKKHQKEILGDAYIAEIVKSKLTGPSKTEIPFEMVCKKCCDVRIKSQDIKVVEGSHHIVINRHFFDTVEKKALLRPKIMDQMISCGSALCSGQPEAGCTCGNKLGSLMIFKNIPFVVLSLTSFKFETEDKHLKEFKSWKEVPFKIQSLKWAEDIHAYLQDEESSHGGSTVTDDVDRRLVQDPGANAMETSSTNLKVPAGPVGGSGRETHPSGQSPEVKGGSESETHPSDQSPEVKGRSDGETHPSDQSPGVKGGNETHLSGQSPGSKGGSETHPSGQSAEVKGQERYALGESLATPLQQFENLSNLSSFHPPPSSAGATNDTETSFEVQISIESDDKGQEE